MSNVRTVSRLLDRASPWIAIGLIVFGIVQLTHTNGQLKKDERNTCTIQSTALEAQRHLTQVLAAFNVFLQPPPTGVVKAKQPPVPAYYEYSLKAVRYHLPLYLQLEREQPASRRC